MLETAAPLSARRLQPRRIAHRHGVMGQHRARLGRRDRLLTSHLLEEWSSNQLVGQGPAERHRFRAGEGRRLGQGRRRRPESPKMEGDNLDFDVQVLEGSLVGSDGPASVFVDIIGLPFTPLSFAGRRAPNRASRGLVRRGRLGRRRVRGLPPLLRPRILPLSTGLWVLPLSALLLIAGVREGAHGRRPPRRRPRREMQ